MDFTTNRFFHVFAGFQKASECRVISGREARLATDERFAFIFGKHDDHRVGAWKMLLCAIAAFAAPSRTKQQRGMSATPAKAVVIVPFNQAAGGAINGGIFGRQHRQGTPDSGRTKCVSGRLNNGDKVRVIIRQAK